ncbi:MAG: efflux RND transporter periplasmic adaptor subunit [Alphaproteobacteria bacterium]|nr:efflux RND transporter periplasmic adaptor subunit [Alphaproteobacteria bacterium]
MLKGVVIFTAAASLGAYMVFTGKLPLPGGPAQMQQPAIAVAAAPDAAQAMPASVAVALSREITEWSEFSGRLRAAEDVQIRPRVSGTVDAVHFSEGDLVKQGQTLFTIDTRPYKALYDQAAAALKGAEARAELTRSDLDRAEKLLAEKAVSQREFDEKKNAWLEADAAVAAGKAAVDLAALDLEYAEVRAPIDGRVGRPDITVGNTVQAGQGVLTTLQSIDPVYADFEMDERAYLRVLKAVRGDGRGGDMPVLMALADETELTREGRIRSFDNQLSGDSGTLRVRAEFKNVDGLLTPGLFARIRLGSPEKSAAVLVNDKAINTDQTRRFVYALDDTGTVGYRPVTLGKLTEDGLRVITEGLAAGDKIVVNGLMRIQPGMKIQPMMVPMETLQSPEAPPQEQPQQPPQQ